MYMYLIDSVYSFNLFHKSCIIVLVFICNAGVALNNDNDNDSDNDNDNDNEHDNEHDFI